MRDLRPTAACLLACALAGAGRAGARDLRAGLPPLVFVSRTAPSAEAAGQVPGLGPHGTFLKLRGTLLERGRDGRVRALLPAGRLLDVADPDVSPDTARVAFAGLERSDGHWRIWQVARAGGEPRCLTCGEPGVEPDADDADPCWWGDTLVFASTRAGGRALYDGSPVTQLWLLPPGGAPRQLTHEPNGALDPVRATHPGRLVFARWWFNPWTSARDGGLTREPARALSPDSVNVWQVVSASLTRDARGEPALADLRLEAGGTLPRRRGMGIQPAPLPGGGMVAVAARNTGLSPRPGTLSLQRFGAPPSPGARLAGAAIGDDREDPYTEAANLAAPAAVAPVALPGGRVLFALDPGGRGHFGLWLTSADGASREALPMGGDEPALALDPAPVLPGRRAARVPPARAAGARDGGAGTFRYLDRDVFAGRGAPARVAGARLRVYRLAGADSVELLRDVSVPRSGRVELELPADRPLFEQLTDARGVALRSAHGPAQVRGFNSGAAGTVSRCAGCHLGHSTLAR